MSVSRHTASDLSLDDGVSRQLLKQAPLKKQSLHGSREVLVEARLCVASFPSAAGTNSVAPSEGE